MLEVNMATFSPGDLCLGTMNRTKIWPKGDPVEREDDDMADVRWEDIGDCRRQLGMVREMAVLPLRHPELLSDLGTKAPYGVLLYGPPGYGETLVARANANETGAEFCQIRRRRS
jgi:transitional endoplasmic reticulum ATPase